MLPFVSAGQLAGFILSLLWVFAGFSHTEYDFTAEIPSKGSWIQQPLDSSAAVSITSPAWHSVITGCCQKVTSSQGVLSSWTSVCQPDKNRAPLNREINWEKAGQTLLPSWTGCGGLAARIIWQAAASGSTGSCSAPVSRIQRQELSCRDCAHQLLLHRCSSADGLLWVLIYTHLHTFLSQISNSDWLKVLLSHQNHTVQLRMVIFLLSKRGK